jgi:FixJ family two-component response regulator
MRRRREAREAYLGASGWFASTYGAAALMMFQPFVTTKPAGMERFASLTPREREVMEGIVAGKPFMRSIMVTPNFR